MLSIQECRDLIENDAEYTDEQILEIRASLYELAELSLDVYLERKRKGDLEGSVHEEKER